MDVWSQFEGTRYIAWHPVACRQDGNMFRCRVF